MQTWFGAYNASVTIAAGNSNGHISMYLTPLTTSAVGFIQIDKIAVDVEAKNVTSGLFLPKLSGYIWHVDCFSGAPATDISWLIDPMLMFSPNTAVEYKMLRLSDLIGVRDVTYRMKAPGIFYIGLECNLMAVAPAGGVTAYMAVNLQGKYQ
jgi:hypothetical protein